MFLPGSLEGLLQLWDREESCRFSPRKQTPAFKPPSPGKGGEPTHSDTSGLKVIGALTSSKWVPKVCLLSQLGFQFLFPQRKWINIERKRLQSS